MAIGVFCVFVSAFPAFSEPGSILTGGSRTPARVVSAHSGLLSPVEMLHGVAVLDLSNCCTALRFWTCQNAARRCRLGHVKLLHGVAVLDLSKCCTALPFGTVPTLRFAGAAAVAKRRIAVCLVRRDKRRRLANQIVVPLGELPRRRRRVPSSVY